MSILIGFWQSLDTKARSRESDAKIPDFTSWSSVTYRVRWDWNPPLWAEKSRWRDCSRCIWVRTVACAWSYPAMDGVCRWAGDAV